MYQILKETARFKADREHLGFLILRGDGRIIASCETQADANMIIEGLGFAYNAGWTMPQYVKDNKCGK